MNVYHLHSNMVRFIIHRAKYYNILYRYLHSNMVRFIITLSLFDVYSSNTFTFQYGQIYYTNTSIYKTKQHIIYIPIWLDLLYQQTYQKQCQAHSFTFQYGQIYYTTLRSSTFRRNIIYIPIWLDLLQCYKQQITQTKENLHSNMVRFIIHTAAGFNKLLAIFTFQYGQIYYQNGNLHTQKKQDHLHSNMVRFIIHSACCVSPIVVHIYIPIWLDLLSFFVV